MISSQSLSVLRSEFVAPQSNSLVADLNTTLNEQVFNIAVTEAEAMVEPNGILNDFRWESIKWVNLGRHSTDNF